MKAALPLANRLATSSDRSSNTGSCLTLSQVFQAMAAQLSKLKFLRQRHVEVVTQSIRPAIPALSAAYATMIASIARRPWLVCTRACHNGFMSRLMNNVWGKGSALQPLTSWVDGRWGKVVEPPWWRHDMETFSTLLNLCMCGERCLKDSEVMVLRPRPDS